MVWPSGATTQVLMWLETSEVPSPSMSSPSLSWESAISVIEGVEAIAPKPAVVRKVSSLTMSKPASPGLAIVPTIFSSMYEVGILVQASKDLSNAVLASASVITGAPSGLGIGSMVLLRCHGTGMQRGSWKMRTSLALIWPGIGDGTLPVTSRLSRKPPATAGAEPMAAASRAATEILAKIPLMASLLLMLSLTEPLFITAPVRSRGSPGSAGGARRAGSSWPCRGGSSRSGPGG